MNNRGTVECAHRVAWTVTNGLIPKKMNVLHHCDVPSCCNPAHLFLGSQKDNVQDMMSKGRHGSRLPDFVERVRLGQNKKKAEAELFGAA